MKIEVKDVSPVRKNMAIEAGADLVEAEKHALLKRYARKAKIPGFRPGKAPLAVVRSRFGREVDEDLKERLATRLYSEAIKEKGLKPLGDPKLEEITLEDGQPFRLEASFDVAPEFTPKSYRDVEVRREAVEVTDADVQKALDELREAHTRFVSEEGRRASTGDVLVADVEGTPEGGETFRKERVMMEVGASTNLPEFNENLEDAAAGSTLEFKVSYPEGYEAEDLAGKPVEYRLSVHEVKRRLVPELDDEFAKDMGDFESLDALRKRIRSDLDQRKRADRDRGLRNSVMDKVLLENPIPLPDALVADETRQRLEDVARMMVHQGVDPRTAEIDWSAMRDRQVEPARKAVHGRLVLDAVAAIEGIEVSDDEVETRLESDAAKVGETATKLRARIEKHGGMEARKIQLGREKSLDFLIAVANIQGEE
jgi:trigger factor